METIVVCDKQNRHWWMLTVLTIMCLYWLSNVVLWKPWSHNPQLGIVLMLTVNPLFWGLGIYGCLACESNTRNLMKKAFQISLIAVGISLFSDFLFFAMYIGSKEVWHITTFYGYAWLVILAFGESLLFKKKLMTKRCVVTMKLLLILIGCLLLLWIFQFYLIKWK